MNRVDVAVVGAGPAGIAAAWSAAETGASVLLVDEQPEIGGQLRWRVQPTIDIDIGLGIDPGPGPQVAGQIEHTLNALDSLTVRTETVAWGLFEDNLLGLSSSSGTDDVQARSVIVASGSTDIALPFPGWTLPGVLTARAVQIFMHVHRVLPGTNWAILGDTPESEELVTDLENAGASIVSRLGSEVDSIRASGTNRLSYVEMGEEVIEVDGLALALGRQPDAELAQQAMADMRFSIELGGFVPVTDESGQTSLPNLFVIGDAAGIGTIPELVAEGRLAGLTAAGARDQIVEQARSELHHKANSERLLARARLQTH